MLDTLIAYRLETPAPGTLHVRLRHVPLTVILVVACVALMGIPLGFACDMASGHDPFGNLNGQSGMAQLLGLLALAMVCVAGPAGLWFWPVRETLVLSRSDARGWRITRNVFGLRRRVAEEFDVDGIRGLCLREVTLNGRAHLLPVMIDREGEPHWLNFGSAILPAGSARADDYLRALAGFFEDIWPEPVKDADEWTRLLQAFKEGKRPPRAGEVPYAGMPPLRARRPAPAAKVAADVKPAGGTDGPLQLSMPARVTVGVVGLFFGLLALNNFIAVLSGLFTGRLASSGSRFSSGTHIVRFATEPTWFAVNVGMESFGVLFLALLAYGCAKAAMLSPAWKRDRASERRSASAVKGKAARGRK
jgi:hypothetical protein